ncbi:MAG: DNA phosphorothioation system sulfurtransferase DndC [Endozoicomonadaceae bacterium]|nr:DNA phosphorothioation system sulfurtransferase DndC [Endozoicomonadaceae bacterium]
MIATSNNDPVSLVSKLNIIQNDIQEAYFENDRPWIIAYSGGKDSTLVLQMVCDMLLSLPKSERTKEVHVISNDTLVESPLVMRHLDKNLQLLEKFKNKHKLPMHIVKTVPDTNDSFWVNLIGKGYIPPTRTFRWCTPKMKITPTEKYIKRVIGRNEETTLLLGVRKSESVNRGRSIKKHSNGGRYNTHSTLQGCLIYSPIVDIENDEIWKILLQRPPAWGTSNRELITLYKNAKGGECPLVISEEDAPSCGSSSPRFGCWTCTVVSKDRSLEGLIDSGFEEFEPLLNFRDWLIELREDNNNRLPIRRNGQVKFRPNGNRVFGPFKMDVREEILKCLKDMEKETNMELIKKSEEFLIERIWAEDKIKQREYING